MRARWVMKDPAPKHPAIGMAHVATSWPGRYYSVRTTDQSAEADYLHRLTCSFAQPGVPWDEVQIRDSFITLVWDTDKDFLSRSRTVHSRVYQSLAEARAGHERIVTLLEERKLSLRNGLNGLLTTQVMDTL